MSPNPSQRERVTRDPAWEWVLRSTPVDARFPYRLQILRNGTPWLSLKAQDRWPGAGKQVFCQRDTDAPTSGDPCEDMERCSLVSVSRLGVRLSLVLDRRSKRRCSFLFLSKAYKGRQGDSYEQIFWQTQQTLVQHRPKIRPPSLRPATPFSVSISTEERYPWRFNGATSVRARLLAGDYALIDGDKTLALVERKTFENLLADLGVLPLLYQRLQDLSAQPNSALVIEAPYEDFISPRRLHHYTPAFCSAAIADLYVRLPNLRVVFCANRKAANAWTQAFFAAVWAARDEPSIS